MEKSFCRAEFCGNVFLLLFLIIPLLFGSFAFPSPGLYDLPVPGSLDSTWGLNGLATPMAGGFWVQALATYPDGKVVAVGGMDSHWYICRIDRFGAADSSFGQDGIVTLFDGDSSWRAMDVVVQLDGKIVVVGNRITDNARFTVVRLNLNGTMDSEFGVGGMVEHLLGSKACISTSLAIQSINGQEKIVVGGCAYTKGYCPALMRLNPNGSLDTTFGSRINPKKPDCTGYFIDETDLKKIGAVSIETGMIAIDDQNRILLGGYHTLSADAMVARYTANGSVDRSFNSNGRIWLQLPSGLSGRVRPRGLAVNGSAVYLSGWFMEIIDNVCVDIDPFIAAYRPDGSVEPLFAGNGFLRIGITGSGYGDQIAVQPEGNILLSVQIDGQDTASACVFRFTSGGFADIGFGPEGNGQSVSIPQMGSVVLELAEGVLFLGGPTLPSFVSPGRLGVAKYYR